MMCEHNFTWAPTWREAAGYQSLSCVSGMAAPSWTLICNPMFVIICVSA